MALADSVDGFLWSDIAGSLVLIGVLALFGLSILLFRRLNRLQSLLSQDDMSLPLARLDARLDHLLKAGDGRDQAIRRELSENRVELTKAIEKHSDITRQVASEQMRLQLEWRDKLDEKMRELQAGNEKKLDEMRQTVDQHLQTALEKRISESFKTVSERLEAVHKGLGEMQTLASGVGDLKRVLSNVKSRGMYGEVQLEAIIADMLTPDQYVRNYDAGRGGHVEFAVQLPASGDRPVHLPIDAKFPTEDYERLLSAADLGDREGVDMASRELERKLRRFAKDIADKYINPPRTTDWAILFLPTESLYAESLRRPGLFESLQRDFKVTLAGPTNLQVLLSIFRMGYRQVAMNEKAQSVMDILGAVRFEFDKYGDQIGAMAKSLDAVRGHLDKLSTRRRQMLRALKDVESLDAPESQALLGVDFDEDPENMD